MPTKAEHSDEFCIHPTPLVRHPDKNRSQSVFVVAVVLSVHSFYLQGPIEVTLGL